MANTIVSKTFGSAGNRQKWTWSAWIKRSSLTSASNGQTLWNCEGSSANDNFIFEIDGGAGSGGATDSLALHTFAGDAFRTTPLLRDVNAWYHIVFALDTTQATATDRIKLYVNGVLQSYSQEANFPTQNYEMGINRAAKHCIGSHGTNADYYFDGSMSHIHFCDGYQYAASDFGQNDANGVWTINTSPSVTYGTNGFFILKDGNSVTDQSGNGNNFTVSGGTLTNTEDNPSNVFATWNPLNPTNPDFSNGNNTLTRNTNSWISAWTTIGASSGKYYCEIDWDSGSNFTVGFSTADVPSSNPTLNDLVGNPSNGGYITVLYESGVIYNNGSNAGAYGSGSTYATGDIMMLAMDLDNNKFYFGKNGTWFNSANPANNTGGYDINSSYTDATWCFGAAVYGTGSWHGNFGNGYFGTTAVSSAGTNASGFGIFEYDVPTGFTALCTKGLNGE